MRLSPRPRVLNFRDIFCGGYVMGAVPALAEQNPLVLDGSSSIAVSR
jgi:hypothetical protein